jgi:hypothetical protein
MQDVWVRAQSIVSGSRAVRADTIVQVRYGSRRTVKKGRSSPLATLRPEPAPVPA